MVLGGIFEVLEIFRIFRGLGIFRVSGIFDSLEIFRPFGIFGVFRVLGIFQGFGDFQDFQDFQGFRIFEFFCNLGREKTLQGRGGGGRCPRKTPTALECSTALELRAAPALSGITGNQDISHMGNVPQ